VNRVWRVRGIARTVHLANRTFKWETTRRVDLGVDAALFRRPGGRLSRTTTTRKTRDLLLLPCPVRRTRVSTSSRTSAVSRIVASAERHDHQPLALGWE